KHSRYTLPDGYACPIKTFLSKPCTSGWGTVCAKMMFIDKDEKKKQRRVDDRLRFMCPPTVWKPGILSAHRRGPASASGAIPWRRAASEGNRDRASRFRTNNRGRH